MSEQQSESAGLFDELCAFGKQAVQEQIDELRGRVLSPFVLAKERIRRQILRGLDVEVGDLQRRTETVAQASAGVSEIAVGKLSLMDKKMETFEKDLRRCTDRVAQIEKAMMSQEKKTRPKMVREHS